MAGSDPRGPRSAADIADAERRRLWRMAGMGGTLASEVLAGALIGWVADQLFGSAPTGLIIMTIAGVLVGMAHFVRAALAMNRAGADRGAGLPALTDLDETDPGEDDHGQDDSR